MIRRLVGISLVGVALLAGALTLGQASSAAPDPVNCTGYPEPRVYLENQSWWTPQVGPASDPRTGSVGHIHIGTCFPLYQKLSGDTLHLDIDVKLHNMQSIPSKLRLSAYQEVQWKGATVPPCPTVDCASSYSVDFPISEIRYKGWRLFGLFLNVSDQNGVIQRNWTHYMAYIDRPEKPDPPPGNIGTFLEDPGGDTWYGGAVGGTTGAYANAQILRADVPWSEQTGELTPVSGTWTPTVKFEAQTNFVYIDPALHAVPLDKGTVVYEAKTSNTGYHTQQLSIDTTQLSDGPHRLLIGSSNVGTAGTNTGVLVIPFLVDNNPCG